jgi:hypothetical protein
MENINFLFKNKYFCYIYIIINNYKLNKNLDLLINYCFENNNEVFLKLLENKIYDLEKNNLIFENLKKLIKNNNFYLIEKMLNEDLLLIQNQRLYIYEAIKLFIDKKVIDNDTVFFEFIQSNKILNKNNKLLTEMTESSFNLNNEKVFNKFLNILINKFYKSHIIMFKKSDYNYLMRTIIEKKNIIFFENMIEKIDNLELLMNVIFSLEPEDQDKLDILFKNENRKNLILNKFKEISKKNKHRNSLPLNKVKKLLNYKKINSF